MSGGKVLLRFYVNSSLHVALAVTALAVITTLHLGLPMNTDLLFFIFFGAVTGYNFIKYAGIAKLHHRSLTKHLKVIQIFSFFSFLALVYYAVRLKPQTLLVAGLFGLLTALYALPVFSKKRNLRTVRGLKVHIISLIWAGVSVLCPVIDAEIVLDRNVALEFIQRYLFVLVLLLPFEIRDLKYDRLHLGTIPQRIGVQRAKSLGLVLLVLMVVSEFLKQTATWASIAAMVTVVFLTGGFLMKAKENQAQHYSSFWVEGIPVLWLFVLIFSENVI